MSVILPPSIALKSSRFYVQYSSDSDAVKDHGLIRVNGGNVFSSSAKFEVVTANTGAGLVHIRCRHNKRFIRKISEGSGFLSPDAEEPEEDQSQWSCTLFEPQAVDDKPDQVRLFHVYAKKYAHAYDEGQIRYWALWDTPDGQNIYDFIDLETLVILPKYVAFKGDNDLYLKHADANQLRFMSTDKGIPESGFEVFTDGDGKVKIKVFNSSNNNYLRFRGGAYGNTFADGNNRNSSEYWPVKVDASTVALKCLSNKGNFCTRYSRDIGSTITRWCRFRLDELVCTRYSGDIESSLVVLNSGSTITRWCRFRLDELVLSRRIYNTDFDVKNAIIYGQTPVTMATANARNATSVDNKVEIKFSYKDSKSSTWTVSHSWMVGLSATVDFKMPFIGEGGEVTAKAEYSGSYQWGETTTTENTLETTYTITVPAHTSICVSLMATKGKCDVPYSYYQKDVLYNGKTVIYKKDDGVYTGVNSYNFLYYVKTLKEPDSTGVDSYNFLYEVPTLKEPDSKANSTSKMKRSLEPSTFSSKQQIIPMPMPYASYGSTTVQIPVTSTTTP